DSSKNAVKNISVTVSANTTYTLLSVNDQGCDGTVSGTVSISVDPLPTVTLTVPQTTICSNAAAITLTGSPSTGGTGVYSVDGVNMAGNSFDPAVYALGARSVKYTFTDGNGCTSSDTKTITIVTKPAVTVNFTPSNICTNASPVTLSGTPAGGTFSGTGVS